MITVNNNYGGTVVINDTPHGWKSNWSKRLFKFCGLYFYVSTCRMKKRPIRNLMFNQKNQDIIKSYKEKIYERQGGGMFGVRTTRRIQGYGTSPCLTLFPIP